MSGRKRWKVHCKQLYLKANFRSKGAKWSKNIPLSASGGTSRKAESKECDSNSCFGSEGIVSEAPEDAGHSYYQRKVSSKLSWKDLQTDMLACYAQEAFMPEDAQCRICEEGKATVRCKDCGHRVFLCRPCALSLHKDRNVFHCLEVMENGIFLPLFINEAPLRVHGHRCNTMEDVQQIVCFDQRGIQHLKQIVFCQCEKPAITLLRLQLWPGSPEKPSCAFHLSLMDLFDRLFIHCKVSLKEATEVFQLFLPAFYPNLLPSFYAVMNSGCFDEYRYFKYQSTYLTQQFPDLYNGASCPLCPKEEGVLVQCMDACFGLNRKKTQGQQLTDPNHTNVYFADQDDVDNFVAQYHEDCQNTEPECSRFHAGEVLPALRSKGKNKLFDEKGVFGSVCRHDFPLSFHNIKHGERISYSVYELKQTCQLLNKKPLIKVVIMYDIACILSTHLKKNAIKFPNEWPLLEKFTFAIPIFHCYGHKASCQIKYSPRRTEGVGLTDGEGTERLWSFLRDFSRITKEMSPEKRIDTLTDGLLHYGCLLRKKYGPALNHKLLRAMDLHQILSDDLDKAMKSFPIKCDETVIEEWISSEKVQDNSKKFELLWDEKYVDLLSQNVSLRGGDQQVSRTEENESLKKKRERIEKSLAALEKKHGIRKRWSVNGEAFSSSRKRLLKKQEEKLLSGLHRLAAERTFLLEMKRKYADGQMIAIKLSGQIDKVVKSMNKGLDEVNVLRRSSASINLLTFDDIKEPTGTLYSSFEDQVSAVPESKKRPLIELFLLCKRCKEEANLVKEEMRRLEEFYSREIQTLSDLHLQQDDSITGKGFSCLLQRRMAILCNEILALASHWKGCYTFQCLDLGKILKSSVKYEGSEPCTVSEEVTEDEPYSFDKPQDDPCNGDDENSNE